MTIRGYIRVSTQNQVEGYSLAAQRQKIHAWAAYQNLADVQIYEDAGISGTRDDRPALTALLLDLQPGDVVVTYALSRLARGGAVQLLGIVHDIRSRNARVVFLQENIDTETSTGRLMLTILGGLAELEIEQTRERTDMGRTQAAREGIYPHSNDSLPTGWQRDETGRLVESEHADTVRLIFAQGNAPYEQTAKMLTERGIVAPRGGKWEVGQVRRIVRYEGYWQGFLNYRATAQPDMPESWIRIPAPPLVTEAVWRTAQRDARTNHAHKRPDKFPLTGHLLCACGTRLVGRDPTISPSARPDNRRRRSYVCYERMRKSPLCPANGRRLNSYYTAETLAQEARALLAAYLLDPSDPANIGVVIGGKAPDDPHARERAEVERRLSLLTRMQLDQAIEYSDYLTMRGELLERRSQIPPPPPAELPPTYSMPGMAETVLTCSNEALAELLDILVVTFQMTTDGAVKLLSLTPIPA